MTSVEVLRRDGRRGAAADGRALYVPANLQPKSVSQRTDITQRTGPTALTYANVVLAKPPPRQTETSPNVSQISSPPISAPAPAAALVPPKTSRRKMAKMSLDEFVQPKAVTTAPVPTAAPLPSVTLSAAVAATVTAATPAAASSMPTPKPKPTPKPSRIKRTIRRERTERTYGWLRRIVVDIADSVCARTDAMSASDSASAPESSDASTVDSDTTAMTRTVRRMIERDHVRRSAAESAPFLARSVRPLSGLERTVYWHSFASYHHGADRLSFASAVLTAHCRQLLSPRLDELTFDLLSALTDFDIRSIQRDPVKGKIRQRFVSGLKQIGKRMRSRTLRCVVVAANVEASASEGSLDDLLEDIIIRADDADVPVVYALSRRRLARAVRQQCRVSAVGVLTSAGADELLTHVLNGAQRLREEFAMIHEDGVLMPNGRERRSEVDALRAARRRAVEERRAEAVRLDNIESDRRAAQVAERERLRTQERRERDRERNRLLVEKNAAIKAERANEEVTTAPATTAKMKAQASTNRRADASEVDDGATILYDTSAAPSDRKRVKSRKRR